MARRMSCKAALTLLPKELSGAITPCDAEGVAKHIQSCRSCSIAYESAREAAECMSERKSDSEQRITRQTAVLCGALTDRELGSGGGK